MNYRHRLSAVRGRAIFGTLGKMNADLTKVTEIFLVPSSFLVAALGTADTNPHRAAVSVIGLTVSVLWLVCSHEALPRGEQSTLQSRRIMILAWVLPMVFIIGWCVSLGVHAWLWNVALQPT